jgi:protein-L-isoaspartate(D-aspartate) O-methyltransferase
VLDIGSATGYSAAVLSRLAGHVVALESDKAFVATARERLPKVGAANCKVIEGPLPAGHAAEAPYDVILIEGAVDQIPAVLFEQLADGGRLIAVEGRGNAAAARLHVKEEATVSQRFGFNCSIQPLSEFRKTSEFVF